MNANGAGAKAVDYLRNLADLNRVGLARHEEKQDAPKKSALQILNENSAGLEALLRSLPQIQTVLADVRRGLRSRANSITVRTLNTATVPATGNGVLFDCAAINGNVPWDSFTVDSVGGAGTTMECSVNGSDFIPVSAGDVFQNLEIWRLTVRVTTGGAGTGRIVFTSYIPGVGGLLGV